MSQNRSEQDVNRWRGRIDQQVESLVNSVGNNEKGLVKEVSDIRMTIVGWKSKMALFAGVGAFFSVVLSSILVAVLLKYVFKI